MPLIKSGFIGFLFVHLCSYLAKSRDHYLFSFLFQEGIQLTFLHKISSHSDLFPVCSVCVVWHHSKWWKGQNMVRKNKEGINECWLLMSDMMDCLKIFIKVLMCGKVLRKVSDIECLKDNFQKLIYAHS